MAAELLIAPELRMLIADEVSRQIADREARREAADCEAHRRAAEREASRGDRDFTLTAMLAGRPGADRTLNRGRYAALGRQIRDLTGATDVRYRLAQAYLLLLDIEARGLGRIAGSTYNILGKLVTPPLLDAPPGPILEIGTLYGLFSSGLVRSFRRRGEFRSLTVIDPFAGQQIQGGQSTWDDLSGAPVTEQVVQANFAEFGLGPDDARAIVGYSTDEDVRALAADREYAVVVVDGDHYEDGVQEDLWWVETVLAPGGIAVMDDFGDDKWRGVETAVRRYLANGGRMELVGAASTTGYLRMPA